jgi:threonine 3-dehydrogenase
MRKRVIFITGASGEVGQALLRDLARDPANQILTMDLHPLPPELRSLSTHVEGDLLNLRLLARLVSEYEMDVIYHLAALLSTRAEIQPEEAHQVNVEATLALLKFAAEESQWRKRSVQFIFPSSIAIYGYARPRDQGISSACASSSGTSRAPCTAATSSTVSSWAPTSAAIIANLLRNSRRPSTFAACASQGLISAYDVPSGGTSDYAPEMLHAAAQGKSLTPASCVRRRASRSWRCPTQCAPCCCWRVAPRALTRQVYNVTSFSLSAAQVRDRVLAAFPCRTDQLRARPQARGDHRFLAGRHRRQRGAHGLELVARIRR